MHASALVVLALLGSLLAALASGAVAVAERGEAVAFYDPLPGGGSMIDNAMTGSTPPVGEPLNVIISGTSSPEVLTENGLLNYARAIGFSNECLGIHLGTPFMADLGDGNGWMNQIVELREDYGNFLLGTCGETLIGGNHFRTWTQNGTDAPSGAVFLAVSNEEDLAEGHTIRPDGYNSGRDDLVAAALGITSFAGVTYHTTAKNITGLMPPGTNSINHNISVDGIVTLLTVNIL